MTRDVSLALVAVFCVFASQTIAFVVIPLEASDLGFSGLAIGGVLAILFAVGLGTDIVVAVMSDHLGRKPPMALGALLGVGAGIFLGLGGDVPLVLGTVMFALCMSLSFGPLLAYITEAASESHAARIQGYNGAIQGLSALVAALTIGVGVDRFGVARGGDLLAILMAVALLIFVTIRETVVRRPRPVKSELVRSYARAFTLLRLRPRLQMATLVALIFTCVSVASSSFLPLYVINDLGQPGIFAGSLLALRNGLMTATSPLFGSIVDRFGFQRAMFGANSVAVAGMLALSLVSEPALLVIPLAMTGIGTAFTAPTANLLVAGATASAERGLGFASSTIAPRLGGLISPLLFGALLDQLGTRAVFAGAGVLGALWLALLAVRVETASPSIRRALGPRRRAS